MERFIYHFAVIVAMSGRLNGEQVAIIKQVMKERDVSGTTLAKLLNYTAGQVSRIINGRIPVSYESAKRLYEALGKAEKIAFLEDQSCLLDVDTPSQSVDDAWSGLYQSYSQKLRESFLKSPLNERAKVIGDLEQLIRKYGKK